MSFAHLEDLHCHSFLSACCPDENMTPRTLLDHAQTHRYRALCLTDHLWDAAVPGASGWYAPQDIEHVCSARPLPQGDVPFYFGCETELPANGVPALAKDHFDLFDFVVIPPNHMHMKGLVRPDGIDTPEKMARVLEDRLENLLMQDLPFEKIGIAHLSGDIINDSLTGADIFRAMDETRMARIFSGYAQAGAGIELNAYAFNNWDTRSADFLRIFSLAKAAGCKFYLCSDAHFVVALDAVSDFLPRVVDALSLTEADRYVIPARAHAGD